MKTLLAAALAIAAIAPVASRRLTVDDLMRLRSIVDVKIAPDGQLKIVGRIKEQFKTSKGKYVAPAPIESKEPGTKTRTART